MPDGVDGSDLELKGEETQEADEEGSKGEGVGD